MSNPGKTKFVAVPDGWKRVTALYNGDNDSTEIRINGSKVEKIMITCRTQAVQFAYSPDGTGLPFAGHPMATSDTFIASSQMMVDNCWFKNEAATTIGYIVITPMMEF